MAEQGQVDVRLLPGQNQGEQSQVGQAPVTMPSAAPAAPMLAPAAQSAAQAWQASQVDRYINMLPLPMQTQYDQAVADMEHFTKDPEFQRLPRDQREARVARYYEHMVPALAPALGTTNPRFNPATVPGQWNFTQADKDRLINNVLGPPTFAQTAGRTLYNVGRMGTYGAGAAVGGMLAGGPESPLAGVGAGLGGTIADQATEPLLRQWLTDLPAPTWGEKGIEAGMEALAGAGMEYGMQGVRGLYGRIPPMAEWRRRLFLGKDFNLTPEETSALQAVERGNTLAGQTGEQQGFPTPQQLLQSRSIDQSAIGKDIETTMMNSFVGKFYSEQQQANFQRAARAATGEMLNNVGGINDSSDAARALTQLWDTSTQGKRQVAQAVYRAMGEITGNPVGDTTTALNTLSQAGRRVDLQHLVDFMQSRLPGEFDGIFDLLTTTRSGTLATLPPTALQPGMPVTFNGAPAVYTGPGAQPGTVAIAVQSGRGPLPTTVPAQAVEATVQAPEASLGDLRIARSLFDKLHRTSQAALGESMGAESLRTAGNTAGYMVHVLDDIMNNMPGLTQEGRAAMRMADRWYREYMDTFYDKAVLRLVWHLKDSPDKLAQALVGANESDLIQKANEVVSSIPSMQFSAIQDPVARLAALVGSNRTVRGSTAWNQVFRPQIQVEFLRDALRMGEAGTEESFKQMLQATPGQMADADFVQRYLVSMDPSKLLGRLQNMSEQTRVAAFGSQTAYRAWLDTAKALQMSEVGLSETGTMTGRIKQTAGMAITSSALSAVARGVVGGGITLAATGSHVAAASVGVGLMVMPVFLSRTLNNPEINRRVIYAINHPNTPSAGRTWELMGRAFRGMVSEFIAQNTAPEVQKAAGER